MTHPTWVIELTFATPMPLDRDTLVALDQDGDPHDWYTAPRPGGPGVRVTVYEDADDGIDLATQISHQVTKWLINHGVQDAHQVELRVLTEEQFDAEAQAPTMPSLVSANGAAEILGVTRQRVHQLHRDNSQFPAPLVQLATGPVWDQKAIEWFNSVWERKAGRPKAAPKAAPKKSKPAAKSVAKVQNIASYRTAKATTKKPPHQIAAKSTRKPARG